MKKAIQILGYLAMVGICIWVILDPSWLDIWTFNKEIIMTNIIKWVPVILLWSPLDNLMDALWRESKLDAWITKIIKKITGNV